jgi:hypothetical protein
MSQEMSSDHTAAIREASQDFQGFKQIGVVEAWLQRRGSAS